MMTANEIANATLDQLTDELGAAGEPSEGLTLEDAREACYRLAGVVAWQGKRYQVQVSPDGQGHCWQDDTYGSFCDEAADEIAEGNTDGEDTFGGQLVRWFEIN